MSNDAQGKRFHVDDNQTEKKKPDAPASDTGTISFTGGIVVVGGKPHVIGGVRMYKMWLEEAPDLVMECMSPTDFVPALMKLLDIMTDGHVTAHLESERDITLDEINAEFRASLEAMLARTPKRD